MRIEGKALLPALALLLIAFRFSAIAQDAEAVANCGPQGTFCARGLSGTAASDCGTPGILCVPMYGLYLEKSPERKKLEEFYKVAVERSDNSLTRLFSEPGAIALKSALDSADNATNQFWVIAVNITDQEITAHFYIRVSKKPVGTTGSPPKGLIYANCKLDSNLCPPSCPHSDSYFSGPTCHDDSNNPFFRDDKVDPNILTNKLFSLLSAGSQIADYPMKLKPHSVGVQGMSVGAPDPDQDTDLYAIALVGARAVDRIEFDERDVLRVGIAEMNTH